MQGGGPGELVHELELLFSLLARTGPGVDGPALTSTQRVVLIELVSAGPLRLGALAASIGLSDPTVSRAVDGLVAAGIVERRPDPDDRRAVLHVATSKGRKWVEQRRTEVAAALDTALEGMPAADRAQLVRLVAALNDELRASGARASAPLRDAARLTMSESVAGRGNPKVTLAVLSIAGLAYAVLSSSVVPALPTIQHDLNASETGVTWLLTGYLLSASVGTAILGRLGDMYGKEHVLLWTLVILAAGTLLAALSHTLALLIAARVIQGVAGGIYPLSFGIIRDEFPRERVAGSIGLISNESG